MVPPPACEKQVVLARKADYALSHKPSNRLSSKDGISVQTDFVCAKGRSRELDAAIPEAKYAAQLAYWR